MGSERFLKALEFAKLKHAGQKRIGGADYVTHPIAVASMLANSGYNEEMQIIALFHDLLEDTDAEENEIAEIGGEEVLRVVKLLTKKPGFIMSEYVAGIKSDPKAKIVKTADRIHNLRCAVCTPDEFKKHYSEESLEWYSDFSPEIEKAAKELISTIGG